MNGTRALQRIGMIAAILSASATVAFADGDAKQGEKVFKKCKACHSVEVGKNKVGPSLAGVIGRKAGTLEGYNYSAGMKEYGAVWDEKTLDTYLTKPKAVVPKTKMIFAGLSKEKDRANLIAFLKQH